MRNLIRFEPAAQRTLEAVFQRYVALVEYEARRMGIDGPVELSPDRSGIVVTVADPPARPAPVLEAETHRVCVDIATVE